MAESLLMASTYLLAVRVVLAAAVVRARTSAAPGGMPVKLRRVRYRPAVARLSDYLEELRALGSVVVPTGLFWEANGGNYTGEGKVCRAG
jgi:hypothetical protein